MKAKREYRSRDSVEVAVLDALVDRHESGMTVFEIRSRVEADIDEIEDALGALKRDELISVNTEEPVVIVPDERVIPDATDDGTGPSLVDRIREKLSL